MKSLSIILLATTLATGCTTLTPPPVPAEDGTSANSREQTSEGRWSGHLSLKLAPFGADGAKGASLSFDLQGQARQGALDLSTPLGTLVASVRWTPSQAALHTSDGQATYASLDELITQVLGEPLPVQALMSWLTGQPDAGQPFIALPPEAGQTASPGFEQAGWRVDTTALPEGILSAQRPGNDRQRGATLRLRLDR